MQICYCEDCGHRIAEEDIRSGVARSVGENQYRCAACDKGREPAAPARTTPPGSTTNTSAVKSRPKTKSHLAATPSARAAPTHKPAAAAKTQANSTVLYLGLAGAGAILILATVMLSSKRSDTVSIEKKPEVAADTEAKKTAVTQPVDNKQPQESERRGGGGLLGAVIENQRNDSGSPREDSAKRRLQEIRSARAKLDPYEYHSQLTDFAWSYRKTAAGVEAQQEVAEIKLESRIIKPAFQWKLNENNGTTANDGAGGTATLKGSAKWASGRQGPCIELPENSDSYIELGNSPGLNFAANAPFTICGWVKTKEKYGLIFSLRNSANDHSDIDIAMGQASGDIREGCLVAVVRDDNNNDPVTIKGDPCADDAWHHIALTRNRSGGVRLYKDGIMVGDGGGNAAAGAITSDLRAIGAELYWITKDAKGGADHRYLAGQFSDFRIYNLQLTSNELKELAK